VVVALHDQHRLAEGAGVALDCIHGVEIAGGWGKASPRPYDIMRIGLECQHDRFCVLFPRLSEAIIDPRQIRGIAFEEFLCGGEVEGFKPVVGSGNV